MWWCPAGRCRSWTRRAGGRRGTGRWAAWRFAGGGGSGTQGRVIFLRPAQEHDYLASLITELRGQGVDFDAHRYDEAVPEKEPPGAVIVDPLLDPIAEAFAGDAHVTPMNATSLCVDRKVFVMLAKGALVVKLPTARVATLISSGVGQPWDPGNGKPMKQWLLVPMASGADWIDLARESRAFTGPG